jgi:hypothetical protein
MADRQDPGAYSALLVTVGYADLQASFIRTHDMLEASGYPALAQLLRQASLRFRDDMTRIARQVSVKATAYIKEEEARSRVRPDSGGDASGKRLEDFVGDSAPLTAVPGSVGINFEPELYDNVPWWWTNESGYSGHVGRVVHGFFYDAGYTSASRPDPGSSREHPLFRAEGPQRDSNSFGPGHDRQSASSGQRGERPGMRIENPIPAREFVLRGYERAEAEWHTEFAAVKARFDREVDKILALIGPHGP